MKRIPSRIDDFGRRHPLLFLAALVGLTAVVTVVLLYQFRGPAVVYEFF